MSHRGTSKARSVFVNGLRNAHAMEMQGLSMMSPQLDRIEDYPDLSSRLRRHMEETERHIERLEAILRDFGADPSATKDVVMMTMGGLATLENDDTDDEVLRNTFADFAFENYEIASYTSLIGLARASGADAAVPLLEENLHEEEQMAAWLESNIWNLTSAYVDLRSGGEQAKP